MRWPVFWRDIQTPAANENANPMAGGATSALTRYAPNPMPVTFSRQRLWMDGLGPGSYWRMWVNGLATPWEIVLGAGETQGRNDTTLAIPGPPTYINARVYNAAGVNRDMRCAYTAEASGNSIIYWALWACAVTAGLTRYASIFFWDSTLQSVESTMQVRCPYPFTAKRMSVRFLSALGAGDSCTITLRRNGANTALTLTFGPGDVAGTINADVAFNTGDAINYQVAWTNPGGASFWPGVGLVLNSSIPRLAPLFSGGGINAVADRYFMVQGQPGTFGSSVAYAANLADHDWACHRLYAWVDPAPGVGASVEFSLLRNGLPTGLACTVAGLDTEAQSDGLVRFEEWDTVGILAHPVGGPATTSAKPSTLWSVPLHIAGGPTIVRVPNTQLIRY